MTPTIHSFLTDATPYIMGVIVALQGWMLKQIIELGKWRAEQTERCKQHGARDTTLENQIPITFKVLADHGAEMETIRTTIVQLDQRVVTGLDGINTRLDKLDTNHLALLRLISNGSEEKE